jgi:predicted negative regulator of RcsB-dependent stress response
VDTEQEELEALQKWWKENGRAVVVGLVLGLGGVFGWTAWQSRAEATAEQVSVVYQSMVEMAASDDHAEALLRADRIIREQPDSEYAALAGLLGAKSAFAIDRTDDANRLLGWVVENASRAELRDVARIRSARLLLDQGEPDAAIAMLAEISTSAFAATVEELRGDILIDDRQSEAAAKAYETALASDSMTSGTRARLQMKLDDLGHRDGSSQSQ